MLKEIFRTEKPVIGVIHLLPLPGSAAWAGDLEDVLNRAEQECLALSSGGADGIIVENFFDAPFAKDRVDMATVSAMTRVVQKVVESSELPVGVNVLRNDALSAMAIATTCGAQFIRVNVLSGAMLTDQGIIEGDARGLQLYRRQLMSESTVRVFADVMVKHAYPISPSADIALAARDTFLRAKADALIVSGTGTGSEPSEQDLERVSRAVPDAPLLIGSGTSRENADKLLKHADGIIVGTSLKRQGVLANPVDVERVRGIVEVVREFRESRSAL